MESEESALQRLLDLCWREPQRGMSLEWWKVYSRKRERFKGALELSADTTNALQDVSDETIGALVSVLSPLTDYMTPEQAGRFVSEEVKKLVGNGNGLKEEELCTEVALTLPAHVADAHEKR